MTSFLIVHKVDGKPSFDIAKQLNQGTPSDPGPWWILVDGHRAYPYFTIPLEDLQVRGTPFFEAMPDMPEGIRDFYVMTQPEKPQRKIEELDLTELGL